MRLGKYLLLTIALIAISSALSYAAPVGLTSEADAATSAKVFEKSDIGIELSIGGIADIVTKREVNIQNGEFEMDAYLGRIGLSLMEKLYLYVDVGQATNMEYAYTTLGENHKVSYEDDLIYGAGLSALIYRWANGLEIGANGSYRQADLKLDTVTINNVTFKRSTLTNISETEFKEYQAALEVAWRTEYFIPYAGAKYSDVELGSDFKIAPQNYSAKGKNADKNYGAFVGLSITPRTGFLSPSAPDSKPLSINLEARFIDEEAFNVGLSYKF